MPQSGRHLDDFSSRPRRQLGFPGGMIPSSALNAGNRHSSLVGIVLNLISPSAENPAKRNPHRKP
jgi:hypothetical protein